MAREKTAPRIDDEKEGLLFSVLLSHTAKNKQPSANR